MLCMSDRMKKIAYPKNSKFVLNILNELKNKVVNTNLKAVRTITVLVYFLDYVSQNGWVIKLPDSFNISCGIVGTRINDTLFISSSSSKKTSSSAASKLFKTEVTKY